MVVSKHLKEKADNPVGITPLILLDNIFLGVKIRKHDDKNKKKKKSKTFPTKSFKVKIMP